MKNYLPLDKRIKLVEILENLLSNKNSIMSDFGFRLYDPILKKDYENIKNCSEIIVFVVEGACYFEYANICDLAKKLGKNIFYGGSDIINGTDLLNEFDILL